MDQDKFNALNDKQKFMLYHYFSNYHFNSVYDNLYKTDKDSTACAESANFLTKEKIKIVIEKYK